MTLFSMVMSSLSLSWSKMESYPFPWTSTKGGIPLSELMVIEKNHPNLSSSCSQLTRFSEITRSFTTSNRNWFSRLVRANSSLPCAWKIEAFGNDGQLSGGEILLHGTCLVKKIWVQKAVEKVCYKAGGGIYNTWCRLLCSSGTWSGEQKGLVRGCARKIQGAKL